MTIENNNNQLIVANSQTTSKKVNNNNKNSRTKTTKLAASNSRTMRICLFTLISISILIICLQTISLNEAKIIKYLIAAPRKKLYAVPVPLPLPVFVKRQRIYTQVPVVPRYVQQPSYGSKELASESYSSQDHYPAYSPGLDYYNQPKESASHSTSTKASSKKSTSSSGSSKDSEKQQTSASSPAKYFSQLANVFGQSYPGLFGAAGAVGGNALASLSSNQRDIVTKLFTGQAKILPPTQFRYLLSGAGAKIPIVDLPSTQSLTDQHEQQDRPMSSSSDNNSTSGGKIEPGNEESASRVYLSSLRSPPRALNSFEHFPGPGGDPFRAAAAANQLSSHQYANAMAARAARLQMLRAAAAASAATNIVPELDDQPDINQLEEAQQQADLQDPLVSSAQEHEFVASSPKLNPEQLFEALQKQQELQSDLVREKEEARIAESNSMALAAQQYGLPIVSRQIHLVNYKA